MCLTDLDLDLDLDLPETTDDEEQAPGPDPIGGQYAGVAWGLAERHDGSDPAPAS